MHTELTNESLLNDMLFKESLSDPHNRNFLIRLLSLVTDFKEDYLKEQQLDVNFEKIIDKTSLNDKSFRADIIIKFDHYIINLESYTSFNNLALDKSLSYVMRIFSTQLDRGQSYDILESVIQINFITNDNSNMGNNLVNTYKLANVEYPYNILSDKFIIKLINVDKIPEKSYTKDEEELLKVLNFIKAKNYEERKEVAKGDELLKDFNEWLDKYMHNEETLEYYHNWDLAIAKEAGFSEGKKEIAKKMISKDVPLEDIIAFTGLTEKEVESLKD